MPEVSFNDLIVIIGMLFLVFAVVVLGGGK